MTRQRQIILEELCSTRSHPTADEICQMVRRRLPHISLGTVYRNLEILSTRGQIQKLEMAGGQRRYDGNVENHYHARCIGCGRVIDLPEVKIPIDESNVAGTTDFQILGHRLEFIGLCPECQKSGSQSPGKRGKEENEQT